MSFNNMFLYIVSLTLMDEQSMSVCQELINKVGDTASLTETCFLVRSNMKATDLRNYIKDNIVPARVYVTKVAHDAAWANVMVPNSLIKEWYDGSTE